MREALNTASQPRHGVLPEVALEEWLAGWPAVRGELEGLLAEYRQVHPDYDPHWTTWVIAEMDDAVTNLAHRAAWLRQHIASPHEE